MPNRTASHPPPQFASARSMKSWQRRIEKQRKEDFLLGMRIVQYRVGQSLEVVGTRPRRVFAVMSLCKRGLRKKVGR